MKWLNPLVWWRKLQRYLDRLLLFPEIDKLAESEKARAKAYACHIVMDAAWNVADWELTEIESDFLNWVLKRC